MDLEKAPRPDDGAPGERVEGDAEGHGGVVAERRPFLHLPLLGRLLVPGVPSANGAGPVSASGGEADEASAAASAGETAER